MLMNRHKDAFRAFVEQMTRLPEAQRAETLACPIEACVNSLHRASTTAAERTQLLTADAWRPLFLFALQNGYAGVVEKFGKLLPQMPHVQCAELLATGAKALRSLMEPGGAAMVDAYSDLCTTIAPSLNPQQREGLRKEIKRNQGAYILGAWRNYSYYSTWKENNPGSYNRFKAMKTALDTELHAT